MNVEVVIEAESGERRIEHLDCAGPLSIGRGADCAICIPDHRVSRRHAVVHLGTDGLRVEDVSSNGTLAAGKLLRRQVADVAPDAPILIGMHTLYVRVLPVPECDPSRTPTSTAIDGMAGATPVSAASSATPTVLAPEPEVGQEPVPGEPALADGAEAAEDGAAGVAGESELEIRREIHRRLLEHLDLARIDTRRLEDPSFRARVLTALRRIVGALGARLPAAWDVDRLVGEMADEVLGLGPLEPLLADPGITEIMVVDANTIYVESGGKLRRARARFTDEHRVRAVIERIVTPLGRRIDESSPLVDARLPDGSRVNAIIKPLALKGCSITIRKFARAPLTLQRLCELQALTPAIGQFLTRSVIARKNIVVAGGTGSGKTTLLNVLSAAIPSDERIVTIEDAAELQLMQPHVVALETRPPNLEGKGEYTVRDLVRNALRMRPDRIVVGECRGGEALDMLQAMNTGHDGSLTTTHANSPEEALSRLETLTLMAGVDLPARAIREQIAASVHLLVQQSRLSDGSRKVTEVAEVCGIDARGGIEVRTIYHFVRGKTSAQGRVEGEFAATGYLPTFLGEFISRGLIRRGEAYL